MLICNQRETPKANYSSLLRINTVDQVVAYLADPRDQDEQPALLQQDCSDEPREAANHIRSYRYRNRVRELERLRNEHQANIFLALMDPDMTDEELEEFFKKEKEKLYGTYGA